MPVESMAVITSGAVLLAASLADIRTRIVKDEYTVMLLLIAAMEIPVIGLGNVVLGALTAVLPFLIVIWRSEGVAIGGADVKIAFGIGAVLGLQKGCIAVSAGVLLAVLVEGIHCMIKSRRKKRSIRDNIRCGFPLVPYMAVSAVIFGIL